MSQYRFDYSSFAYDPDDPLARQKGESKRANQALRDYAYMGAARSLPKLLSRYRLSTEPQPTKSLPTLKTWSDRLQWQARVNLFDEAERQREEEEWIERRKQIRQLDFEHGEKLRELFEQVMSDAPNYLKTRRRTQRGSPRVIAADGRVISEGEPDREYVTIALDVNLMLRAGKLGSELQRLAAEMETERTVAETSTQSPALPPIDISDMDEAKYRETLINVRRYAESVVGEPSQI